MWDIREMKLPEKYLVLDVETANRTRDSICQIGITYVCNNSVKSNVCINLNPECEFEAYNMSLHQITPQAVKDAITFQQSYDTLKKILENIPVFHHGDFDPQSILASCKRYRLPYINAKWINSIDYFKKYWPNYPSYELSILCKYHKIEFQHHDAGHDSLATARLLYLAANHSALNVPSDFILENNLWGPEIVFTGDMNKAELKKIAINRGLQVKGGVTSKTAILCIGKTDQRTLDSGNTKSGKQKRAEELIAKGQKLQIISEAEFRAIYNT